MAQELRNLFDNCN